eukprot:SAG31_NODE_44254_length_263_cov_1.097561_1_plen_37_part_10
MLLEIVSNKLYPMVAVVVQLRVLILDIRLRWPNYIEL